MLGLGGRLIRKLREVEQMMVEMWNLNEDC
jgi:hypothetical protein